MRNKVKFLLGCLLVIGWVGCHHREMPRPTDTPVIQETELVAPVPFEPIESEKSEAEGAFFDQEYQKAPWLTLDALAHILHHYFKHLFPVNRMPPVIVDLDQSVHQEALLASVAAGLIPVGRDHRVRPGSRIRKLDMSHAVWRVMELAEALPNQSILDTSLLPYDITPSHNAWKEVAACLFTGVLKTDSDNLFHSGRIMNGGEILDSLDDLRHYLARHGK